MLAKTNRGKVSIVDGAENQPVVAQFLSHKDKKFVKAGLVLLYYSYSPEGVSLYHDLPRNKKAIRIQQAYLNGYDVQEVLDSIVYEEFENLYIETMYSPEWALYMSWQKDADAYIKMLKNIKMNLENKDEKFTALKRAQELLKLGKELKQLASNSSKFDKRSDNEYKPRLFETVD